MTWSIWACCWQLRSSSAWRWAHQSTPCRMRTVCQSRQHGWPFFFYCK